MTDTPQIAWRMRLAAALSTIERTEATIRQGRREAVARVPHRRGQTERVVIALGKIRFDQSEIGRQLGDTLAEAHRDAQTYALAIIADQAR